LPLPFAAVVGVAAGVDEAGVVDEPQALKSTIHKERQQNSQKSGRVDGG
jgi:hypothetical protein